jgi:hypothetical protein
VFVTSTLDIGEMGNFDLLRTWLESTFFTTFAYGCSEQGFSYGRKKLFILEKLVGVDSVEELVGHCANCKKSIYCLDGFFNGIQEEGGKIYCFSCGKSEDEEDE